MTTTGLRTCPIEDQITIMTIGDKMRETTVVTVVIPITQFAAILADKRDTFREHAP